MTQSEVTNRFNRLSTHTQLIEQHGDTACPPSISMPWTLLRSKGTKGAPHPQGLAIRGHLNE